MEEKVRLSDIASELGLSTAAMSYVFHGETAEEAVKREVREETGVDMEVDRLGFVHENYFYGDAPANMGKLIYEISFYFYMEVPPDFAPVCASFTEDGQKEFLHWVPVDMPVPYYPGFFRTELLAPSREVKYFLTDERRRCITISYGEK